MRQPTARLRRSYAAALAASAAWGLCALAGCHLLVTPDAANKVEQVLRPAQSSPDSVALEIVLVMIPDDRLGHLEEVWQQADELILGADTRRALARNGLRAGIIGPTPPAGLGELLKLDAAPEGPPSSWQEMPLHKCPTITGRLTQLRPDTRTEVRAPTTCEELSLFIGTDAGLVGRKYEQAQGVYALQWRHLSPGRIEVELTPEIHHGTPRKQFAPGEGKHWQIQISQSRDIFEDLRIGAPLSAGQMLLVAGDPQNRGSLGHHFHTLPTAEGGQQRILLIRLAQVPDAGP